MDVPWFWFDFIPLSLLEIVDLHFFHCIPVLILLTPTLVPDRLLFLVSMPLRKAVVMTNKKSYK